MILNEPQRTPYDLRFSLLGIPVRVHPMFWLVAVLFGFRGEPKPQELVLWVAVVFVSILVHEMGHALAARAHGFEPWITLHGFGGLASYQASRQTPRARIAITLAGPVAGFLLAAVVLALVALSGHRVRYAWPDFMLPFVWEPYESRPLNWLILDLLWVNIFWGLVNLLPVYPLDGGQISQEVFQVVNPRDGLRLSLWLSVIVAAGCGIVALVHLEDTFLAIFCAYLAYTSYATLQAYFGPGGGWGEYR